MAREPVISGAGGNAGAVPELTTTRYASQVGQEQIPYVPVDADRYNLGGSNLYRTDQVDPSLSLRTSNVSPNLSLMTRADTTYTPREGITFNQPVSSQADYNAIQPTGLGGRTLGGDLGYGSATPSATSGGQGAQQGITTTPQPNAQGVGGFYDVW